MAAANAYELEVGCDFRDFADPIFGVVELTWRIDRRDKEGKKNKESNTDADCCGDLHCKTCKDKRWNIINTSRGVKVADAVYFVKEAINVGAGVRWTSVDEYFGDMMSPEEEQAVRQCWSSTVGVVQQQVI